MSIQLSVECYKLLAGTVVSYVCYLNKHFCHATVTLPVMSILELFFSQFTLFFIFVFFCSVVLGYCHRCSQKNVFFSLELTLVLVE